MFCCCGCLLLCRLFCCMFCCVLGCWGKWAGRDRLGRDGRAKCRFLWAFLEGAFGSSCSRSGNITNPYTTTITTNTASTFVGRFGFT